MIRAFARFYFAPSLANWRALRRLCMKRIQPVKRVAWKVKAIA